MFRARDFIIAAGTGNVKSTLGLPTETSCDPVLKTLPPEFSQSCPEASPMHFPMYTVSMAAVLQMQAVKPHEELQENGTLTVFHEGMGRAAFVSHQWVGKKHPDPEHKQFLSS